MVAVTVLFEVDDPHLSEFMDAMSRQARRSLEQDYRQFDVCVDPGPTVNGCFSTRSTQTSSWDYGKSRLNRHPES